MTTCTATAPQIKRAAAATQLEEIAAALEAEAHESGLSEDVTAGYFEAADACRARARELRV